MHIAVPFQHLPVRLIRRSMYDAPDDIQIIPTVKHTSPLRHRSIPDPVGSPTPDEFLGGRSPLRCSVLRPYAFSLCAHRPSPSSGDIRSASFPPRPCLGDWALMPLLLPPGTRRKRPRSSPSRHPHIDSFHLMNYELSAVTFVVRECATFAALADGVAAGAPVYPDAIV